MPSWEERRRRQQQRTLRKRMNEDKEEGLEDRTVPLEVVKLDSVAKIRGESNPWRHCKVRFIRNILTTSLKILRPLIFSGRATVLPEQLARERLSLDPSWLRA